MHPLGMKLIEPVERIIVNCEIGGVWLEWVRGIFLQGELSKIRKKLFF
jgi:hypothetical protein